MDMGFENVAVPEQGDVAFGLRALTWHGLCAQITAMQDLRRALLVPAAPVAGGVAGSFDARTARFVAAGFSGVPAQGAGREPPVNPTSSANCKAHADTIPPAMTGVWTGHAEARD